MHSYVDTKQLASDAKFYESYSRFIDEKGRYETWDESVERVMDMHRIKYKDKMTDTLQGLIDDSEQAYKEKVFLGAQRALQYGGEQLLKHNFRLYNCTSSHADRVEFFGEYFYIALCGAGVGFSVQFQHVNKLPRIVPRHKQAKVHIIEDSIEGWATALDVLMSSFFENGGKHPEYGQRKIYFDYSKIRPKGSFISGGFKAPGPEPLKRALNNIENLLNSIDEYKRQLKPIEAYDICMYAADAVIAGGIRRAATICLFSLNDQEMMEAKTGNWYDINPQRARSNNSVVILRNSITFAEFHDIFYKIREFGEPGFFFVDDLDIATNPCVEIGMYPIFEGESGFQGCNLTEINGAKCNSKEEFFKACKYAAIVGTLQAGYTDFKFVSDVTKKIFDREALLGVSLTGWMNNPDVLLDAETLREGARIVLEWNDIVAKLIGINPAARATCVKPAGNASVLLMTASGVHGEHSDMYLRYMQMNKDTEVAKLIKRVNPEMVEESVWSQNKTDYNIAFPFIAQKGSKFKSDMLGTKQLDIIKLIQENWVLPGTRIERCVIPEVRHNVSNTVTVDDWDKVAKYIYENRQYFTGVSLLAMSGDKDYQQAPNTSVYNEKQLVKMYGPAAIFAAGLVVDGINAFNGSLWVACSTVFGIGEDLSDDMNHNILLKRDWVRRFAKFADNYFNGNQKMAEYCVKDVHLFHKWNKIQSSYKQIDWISELTTKEWTDMDTMGAIACAGPQGCVV